MSGIVRKLPAARRDLVEAFVFLGRESVSAARRFLQQAEATFDRLARASGMGTRYETDDPACSELRCFPISRFRKYLVFYRPIEDGIEVVRVLHGARDISAILADELNLDIGSGDEDALDSPHV